MGNQFRWNNRSHGKFMVLLDGKKKNKWETEWENEKEEISWMVKLMGFQNGANSIDGKIDGFTNRRKKREW